MMNQIAAFLFLLFPFVSFGQSTSIELPEKGDTQKELIPDGWRVLSHSVGDLNKDDIKDLVFAVQNTDKQNFKANNGLGVDTLDINPRILGIYFGTENRGFIKQFQSNTFIIHRHSPTMEEPFDGLKITSKGILIANFHVFYSAGSWLMSNHTYKFRYQHNRFELIGYDSIETHRATGKMTEYSINFLTGKLKVIKGSIGKDEPDSTEWKDFELKKLKSIGSLEQPFEWKFQGIIL